MQTIGKIAIGIFEDMATLTPAEKAKAADIPKLELFHHAATFLAARLSGDGHDNASIDAELAKARAEFEKGLPACESPIEKRILPFLICQDYGGLNPTFASVHVLGIDTAKPPSPVAIIPQMPAFGYRLDFCVVATVKDARFTIAVECDGKPFHDKAKDAERDRRLRDWGIQTVRVTGSEAHREPRQCARLVANVLVQTIHNAGLL